LANAQVSVGVLKSQNISRKIADSFQERSKGNEREGMKQKKKIPYNAKLEVFMTMKIQIVVL
jgi:hypothetical protein